MSSHIKLADVKLGRLPSIRDRRTLHLISFLPAPLPPLPASHHTAPQVKKTPTWSNTRYGDCTVAARANQCWLEDVEHGVQPIDDERLIVNEYFDLTNGADVGLSLLEALKHWRRVPFLNKEPIHAYAGVDLADMDEVKWTIANLGTLYCALWMPIAWQRTAIWTTGLGPAYHAGSWGGHCVEIHAYDADFLTCFTWGYLQKITWNALRAYSDEAYAVLGPDWATATMPSPYGLDLASLSTYLDQISITPFQGD